MTARSQMDLPSALHTAVGFLVRAQDPAGAWQDFFLPAGESNVWVTSFVGGALATRPEPEAQQAAQAGWQFLERVTSPDGGWSYNPTVPGDADSTLWGLRLAEALGASESEAARRAVAFFEQHLREDGGLATYASDAPVRKYVKLPLMIPFGGWTQSHVCVTAAGANLDAYRERFYPYLLRRQADDGRWPAYWWFADEYATAEATAALAGKERTAADVEPDHAARIDRAAQWALNRSRLLITEDAPQPPVFALAHALRTLARASRRDEVEAALMAGVGRLIEWQKPDGSWPASARLRVPRPDTLVPDSQAQWTLWSGMPAGPPTIQNILKHTFNIYTMDTRAVYTTAAVLQALQEISRLGFDAT